MYPGISQKIRFMGMWIRRQVALANHSICFMANRIDVTVENNGQRSDVLENNAVYTSFPLSFF